MGQLAGYKNEVCCLGLQGSTKASQYRKDITWHHQGRHKVVCLHSPQHTKCFWLSSPRGCAQVYLSVASWSTWLLLQICRVPASGYHLAWSSWVGGGWRGPAFPSGRKLLRRVASKQTSVLQSLLQTWQTSSSWNAAKLKNMCPTVHKQCSWCQCADTPLNSILCAEKVAAMSYSCPFSFPASISLSARKAFSAANIEAASQAERLTSPRKCSTGEPELSIHLKQIESSSICCYICRLISQYLNRMQLL